ncbi:MAG: NfeD family protein [Acidobacteriota bacterium]|nr:NfeD family protein [Acidobacteriota bacterium]
MNAFLLFIVTLCALALALAAYVFLSSRHKKSSRLPFDLVGRAASVERPLSPQGFVLVDGELWPARARAGVAVGPGRNNVRVVGAAGCVLEVEPLGGGPPQVAAGVSRNGRGGDSGNARGVARKVLLRAAASTEAVEP